MKSIKQIRESNLEEVSKKKRSDMARVNAGAMSKSEFDSKWKKPAKKKLAGPGGLYKNLVKEENVDEAHKVGDKVKIVGGPKDVQGKMGRIGEIKHGLHKTAAKTYTVDHDAGSVQLGKEHLRAIKEELGAGELGTAELTNKYKNATPGQSSNVTEEKNFKVTFAHEHPEGEKKHEYVVKAKHQNDADHKAIAMHQKAHPNGKFTMWDSQQIHEDAEEDMAKHHDAAQAAKAAGDNDAFHKHMDAKFEVAKKRDAENAKKPVTRMEEDLENACWKGYEAIGMKMKNGRKVPNCVPKEGVKEGTEESLDESVHGVKAAKFSQKAKLNPSISTHVRASDAHAKAASAYEKKIAAHIKSGGEASELKPLETMAKSHNRSSTLHKFMAHRLVKQGLKEAVEMAAEAADEKINLKITRHSQLALNAEKRGDKAAQKFHLDMVSKLKAGEGAVNEEAEHDDDQEEIIMAKGQLLKIADMAKDLADSMDDEDELEAWIQAKITSARDQMDDVHSYVEYTQDLYDDQPEAEKEYATEQVNEDVASNNDAKELARMQMLVRLGLLDRLKLNTVTRAIKKLDNKIPVTTTAEKDVLFELLQNLIGAISSDESIFRKVKYNVANKS
jgi:hypothetical protein